MGLLHHSIIGVEKYPVYDGLYKNDTDAKALSVGLVQWKYEDKNGMKYSQKYGLTENYSIKKFGISLSLLYFCKVNGHFKMFT